MTRLLTILLLLITQPAHADCTVNQPVDAQPKQAITVNVCAQVVDTVDTSRPTVNADELADMMAVAMLDKTVTVNNEGENK